jgi:hypothetical protein
MWLNLQGKTETILRQKQPLKHEKWHKTNKKDKIRQNKKLQAVDGNPVLV